VAVARHRAPDGLPDRRVRVRCHRPHGRDLFITRGIHLGHAGRRPQAAVQLAGQAGDPVRLGLALLDLSDTVTSADPAAGAEAARAAAAQLRRAGDRRRLAAAVMNLALALLMTGDWDAAEAELAQAAGADGLADIEYPAGDRARLAALRGEVSAAQAALAALGDLRASEDPRSRRSSRSLPNPRFTGEATELRVAAPIIRSVTPMTAIPAARLPCISASDTCALGPGQHPSLSVIRSQDWRVACRLCVPQQVQTRGYRSQSLPFSSARLINGRVATCSCWSRSAVLI
jgi:hypothetical protein